MGLNQKCISLTSRTQGLRSSHKECTKYSKPYSAKKVISKAMKNMRVVDVVEYMRKVPLPTHALQSRKPVPSHMGQSPVPSHIGHTAFGLNMMSLPVPPHQEHVPVPVLWQESHTNSPAPLHFGHVLPYESPSM